MFYPPPFVKHLKFIVLYFICLPALAQTGDTTSFIKTDQFGYTPDAEKVAVISNPQNGFNASRSFSPGNTYEVRQWSNDEVVYSGTPQAWNSGNTHGQSGDRAWWFDFSNVKEQGKYYIYDADNDLRSFGFRIHKNTYGRALYHAFRTFYYQRCGTAKETPYAGDGWTDEACHINSEQDQDCRLFSNPDPSNSKDLSGGWHDAGDYNKYVNFAWDPVLSLLQAYKHYPEVWTDDFNIPESGNGIPDLMDEIKYEMDWLLKMQQSNGAVLSVVGGGAASPPSADTEQRRYGPPNTSAALSAAGMFAFGAMQFDKTGMTDYADTLEQAAKDAWTWAGNYPDSTFNNSGKLAAGEQELNVYQRKARKITASCFLFARTGNTTYKSYFDNNYDTLELMRWNYAYPFQAHEQSAALYYTQLNNATDSVANNIRSAYQNSIENGGDNYPAIANNNDAYRAYLSNSSYTWGSNRVKCAKANMFLDMNHYNLNSQDSSKYVRAAENYLHYLHGVNPLNWVYLSNMDAHGAENSINEFYHSWFTHGSTKWDRAGTSDYGPAPGFVPGGPNPNYSKADCCPSSCGSTANNDKCTSVDLTPPLNQPEQKSYKDWNTGWPQNSWEVTENALGYQSMYLKLLARYTEEGKNDIVAGSLNTSQPKNTVAVKVYPNPASGRITIDLPENVKKGPVTIRILSTPGKVLMSKQIIPDNGKATLSTASLAPGTYILKGNSAGKEQFTRKLFIK